MKLPNIMITVVLLIFTSFPVAAADISPQRELREAEYFTGLDELVKGLYNRLADPEDPQSRADLYRYAYATLSQGYFALFYQNPRYPEFWPMFNEPYSFFFANTDDSYYQAVVEDDGVYEISGFRGKTRLVEFQVNSGLFNPYGSGPKGPTLSNYNVDSDAHVNEDGSFKVILSATRPDGYKGDWWELKPGATYIWVRQRAYNWNDEDGRFAIQRLDTPAIKPRDSADQLQSKLAQIYTFTRNWMEYALDWAAKLRQRGLVNKIAVDDLSGSGGLGDQRYLQGLFELAPDEALILETEVPDSCQYWMFQLGDEFMATIGWANRQISFNGFNAHMSSDGKFRAVISAKDPGVPNWMDNAGYRRGHIMGRWKGCNSYPQPEITKVMLADVRKYLPKDTPVVSAEQRSSDVRARARATHLRRRW